jgi:hypothetical protein
VLANSDLTRLRLGVVGGPIETFEQVRQGLSQVFPVGVTDEQADQVSGGV